MEEITAQELKERLGRSDKLQLVDVREPEEHREWKIPGSVNVPLG